MSFSPDQKGSKEHLLPSKHEVIRSLPRRKRQLVLGLTAISLASLYAFPAQLSPFHKPHPKTEETDIFPDTDYPLRPAIEPWDISTSYPYPRKLEKTVTEGTWLRIATHPSRREIVFDMLGDLYCMPLDKSENESREITAYPFLAGVPYEKEASFSADGKSIVFISDAGFGIDNIWTLPYTTCGHFSKLSGEDVRASAIQQTNSTFRFFSSPAFHPTLPKIIATKWFLTGRPNGAGELWEFPLRHKSEGINNDEGHRLVARKLPASWPVERYGESQLGAEQGRYFGGHGDSVIYTRNIRDDDTGLFSYNKDVHKGVNAVFVYNTTTKSTQKLIDAKPGGANMPRVSHDGKTVAFVRRVKEKSVLVLKDMTSGTIHHVWNELTYDVSLIPAFMGAYPNFGFSANDESIIIWSSGKIWEVPLKVNHLGERIGGAEPRVVPFEATINIALGNTRYNETDIRKTELQEKEQIHALRGLRSDYDGNMVIFEGAGDLYQFVLETQQLSKLPKLSPSSQYYSTSFGRDPSHIIVARWSEQNLTTFELIHDGQGRIVTGIPRGRYISPVVGCGKIAFVRTGADYMFGDVEETQGTGIWLGDLDSNAAVTNLRNIDAYGTEDAKLEFKHRDATICSAPASTILQLQSVKSAREFDFEGNFVGVVASSKTSMEMVATSAVREGFWSKISESLFGARKVVAFKDFQHIWLAMTTPEKAQNIWSKPGDPSTPENLVRLSREGGHDVTFSGDGKTVFWFSGPNLWYASVNGVHQQCAFATRAFRDSGSCASSVVKVVPIKVEYETDLSKVYEESEGQHLVFMNATIVSMDSSLPDLIHNGTIIVRGGEIISVGPGTGISIPEISHVVQVHGGVILPGFVDVHGHWGGFLSQYPSTSWEQEAFLGYGVTTIHNPSSTNVGGFVERALVEKGAFHGPRIYHTGTVLYGSTRSDCYTEINSLADAHDALLRVKIEGGPSSFSVKNYQIQSRSARQRLLLEAKKLDMLVFPEGGWSFDWDLTYFIDGMTTLEHPVPIATLYDDVLSLIAASGSSYTQISVMNYGGLFGQHWVHQNHDIPEDEKLRKYVKHDLLEMLTEVKQAPDHSYHFFNTSISSQKLAERGVRTNIGAHGEMPIGFLFHSEMEMLEVGGQGAYDVLRAATIDGATSLGLNSSIGSIVPGKLADLVVYPPGVDSIEKVWKTSRDLRSVVRGGRMFDVADGLVEAWPSEGRRLPKARINPEDE